MLIVLLGVTNARHKLALIRQLTIHLERELAFCLQARTLLGA
jgi:hypothetical protein